MADAAGGGVLSPPRTVHDCRGHRLHLAGRAQLSAVRVPHPQGMLIGTAGLAAVSGSIEKLAQQVQAATELANDIVAQATAVADGT